MTTRRITGVLITSVLITVLAAGLVGCSSGAGPSSATPSPTSTEGGSSAAPAADPATALCQRFATSSTTLRGVLDTARQGPVLGPALYLLLMSPRNIASTPGVTDPGLAKAMQELVAALDELADQAQRKLPPGADPAQTPVQLDTARASAALTAATDACRVAGR
ncbi:MAG: hypothetical protein H0W01_08620 [Pseudonocardiales bacterium]|nr:hypothetical protein [Pseudonocardiales bacterium]